MCLWILLSVRPWFDKFIWIPALKSDNSMKKNKHLFGIPKVITFSQYKPTAVTLLLLQISFHPNFYELSFFPLLCCSLKTLWIKPLWTTKALGSLHCICLYHFFHLAPSILSVNYYQNTFSLLSTYPSLLFLSSLLLLLFFCLNPFNPPSDCTCPPTFLSPFKIQICQTNK